MAITVIKINMKIKFRNKKTGMIREFEWTMINSSLLTAQHRKRIYFVGALQEDGSYKKIEISGLGSKTGLYEIKDMVRKLTPIECERLQGYPEGYSEGVSQTQRYKALGNSFTVPVIKHILKELKL